MKQCPFCKNENHVEVSPIENSENVTFSCPYCGDFIISPQIEEELNDKQRSQCSYLAAEKKLLRGTQTEISLTSQEELENLLSEFTDVEAPLKPAENNDRTWKKGFWIFCTVLLLTVLWAACSLHSVPLKVSPETTFITEPLQKGGTRVDYTQAYKNRVYPEQMKTDENGFRVIAQNIGMADYPVYAKYSLLEKDYSWYESPKSPRRQSVPCIQPAVGMQKAPIVYDSMLPQPFSPTSRMMNSDDYFTREMGKAIESQTKRTPLKSVACSELGLSCNAPPVKFEDPGVFLLRQSGFSLDDNIVPSKVEEIMSIIKGDSKKLFETSWSLKELPAMEEWLNDNNAALDLIADAVKKPCFRIPIVKTDSLLDSFRTDDDRYYYSLGYAFAARINYRIGTGDIGGAIEDKIALMGLGRWLGKQAGSRHLLMGTNIEFGSRGTGIASNPEAQPTAGQLRRFLELLHELPSVASLKDIVYADCVALLDSLQEDAFEPTFVPKESDDYGDFFRQQCIALDWNIVYRRINKFYDGEIDSLPEHPPVFFNFFSRRKRSEHFADQLLRIHDRKFMEAWDWYCITINDFNLHTIVLALLLHQSENGKLPPAFTVDSSKKPLHSWRVLILPYFQIKEYSELYHKIRLDEPWDSEYNSQFHKMQPVVYRHPSYSEDEDRTFFTVTAQENKAFGQDGTERNLDELGPEKLNTVLVFESQILRNWMDPTPDLPENNAKKENRLIWGLGNGSVKYNTQMAP